MIKNYFKIAFRSLWRHKRMTTINVAGLGIGMAATVLIALWVQNELSFDKDQPEAANIYRVKSKIAISKTQTWLWETSPYILGDYAAKEIPGIENLTRLKSFSAADVNFHYNGDIITEKKSAYVDAQWFNMFHYDFVDGSVTDFLRNPFSIILTQSAAKKYFGNQQPVGKILKLDSVNYQVQAILKDSPANSSFQYNVLMPIAAWFTNASEKKNDMDWGNYNYMTFVKLKSGTSPAGVASKLMSIDDKNNGDKESKSNFSLVKLQDIHFENDLMNSALIHGNHTIVNVFIVLAALLLTTACINYVNLTTARASIRAKEVSVRKIVGAGRLHLFGQFMSESLVVSFAALVLALLLVQISLPWFGNFTDKQFSQPVLSPVVWGIVGLTLIVSFLLNGLYPAFLLSSFRPLSVFRGKSVLNFKDTGLRRLMVVIQFTISVILIVGTLVIYSQLNFIQKLDPGYNRSQVFSFTVSWKLWKGDFTKQEGVLNTIKQQLQQQSAIADVSMASRGLVDFENESSGSFDWDGRPKDFKPSISPLRTDENFQKMMQIKVKEGRWFNGEKADKHNVLLNETAVKIFNLRMPFIGQRFIHQRDTGVILGVVKDFHYRSLHDKIGPMVISNSSANGFYIKTNPGNAQAAIAAAQKVMKSFLPDDPFVYDFLDDSYNKLYKTEQQSAVLITLFAAIAIFISALGLLGLAAFAAEQKVKEIGIRKVLGASLQHIFGLLSADFLKMVLIASVIAFPVGWYAMNKWLQEFAYRINLSWWIFLAAGSIALIIALITVSFQAVKAALANPVNSLRSE